ncbi:hypothetical protein CLOM_g15451 [Closterium sp. NIES-68]|nr:hypothetical protein CLOM_g15451 [Closterium sp. NIES-68]
MDRIEPDALPAVLLDAAKRDHSSSSNSIVTTAFGFTRRFDPHKPVTRGQAAIALATAGEGGERVSEAVGRARVERAAAAALEAAQAEAERREREEVRESVGRDERVGEERRVREAVEEVAGVLQRTAERVEREMEQEKASIHHLQSKVQEQQQQAERERQQQQQAALALQQQVQQERHAVRQQWEEVQAMLGQAEEAAERARARERDVQGEKEALQRARAEAEAELVLVRVASERVQQAWREVVEREREVRGREEQERERRQELEEKQYLLMEKRENQEQEQEQEQQGWEGKQARAEEAEVAVDMSTAPDTDSTTPAGGLASFIGRIISLSPFSRSHPPLEATPPSVAAPVAVGPSEWGMKVAAEAAHATTPAPAEGTNPTAADRTNVSASGDAKDLGVHDMAVKARPGLPGLQAEVLDPQAWKARASDLVQPLGERAREAVRAAERGIVKVGERMEGFKEQVKVSQMELDLSRAVGEAGKWAGKVVEEGRRVVEGGAKTVEGAGGAARERVGGMVNASGRKMEEVVMAGGRKVEEMVGVGGKAIEEVKGRVDDSLVQLRVKAEEAWGKVAGSRGEGGRRGNSGSAS